MIQSSILIITRDRSFILGDCLRALRPELDLNRHEVVVLDSSPDHKTEEVIKEFSFVRYHRVSLPLGTRPQSYSMGARLCCGKIVVLLDDDSIVFSGWLERIEACYGREDVGAAGGRVLPKDESGLKAPEGDFAVGALLPNGQIVSNLYVDTGSRLEVDTLRGCNMSVRRDLLEQMNYFDNRFRGQNCRVEDDICLWVKRMGYQVIYNPKAVVRHLAEQRPDIPRSEKNMRSEFYVWRNTVWLYVKHFGLKPSFFLRIGLLSPLSLGFRRVFGGSLKRPKLTREGLGYTGAALAGLAGGLWGCLMSVLYHLEGSSRRIKTLGWLRFEKGRVAAPQARS